MVFNSYKTALVASLLLCQSKLFSQTVTCQSNCPQAGEIFSMRTSSPVINNGGTNQLWNFSNLAAVSPVTHSISYTSPVAEPSASLYPQANLVRNDNSGTSFLVTSGNGIQLAPYSNNSMTTEAIELPLPFSYGDTYTQTVSSTSVSGSDTYMTTQEITFTGHGTGTLILPSGSYNDVLSVKYYNKKYSTKNGIPFGYIYYNTSYRYYSPQIHQHLFYSRLITETGPTDWGPYTEFLDNLVTGITEQTNGNVEDLLTYPNPVIDRLTIKMPLAGSKTVVITDVLGVKLSELVINGNEYTTDVTGLASGVYFATVQSGQILKSRKFIISH